MIYHDIYFNPLGFERNYGDLRCGTSWLPMGSAFQLQCLLPSTLFSRIRWDRCGPWTPSSLGQSSINIYKRTTFIHVHPFSSISTAMLKYWRVFKMKHDVVEKCSSAAPFLSRCMICFSAWWSGTYGARKRTSGHWALALHWHCTIACATSHRVDPSKIGLAPFAIQNIHENPKIFFFPRDRTSSGGVLMFS